MIGRFSLDNRILRSINSLRYTRQPTRIIRASSPEGIAGLIRSADLKKGVRETPRDAAVPDPVLGVLLFMVGRCERMERPVVRK
jgi:hypothetical protein